MALKVNVNGEDKTIPAGVELLGEVDLYSANFSLLQLSDYPEEVVEDVYKWSNPRRTGDEDKGAGLGKMDMEELFTDIKEEGIMSPLICRWVVKDGSLAIQVLDGERRWRCLDKLIAADEKVWCRGQKKWRPATEVYKTVPCRIVTGDDREALKVAFMVSDRSINWGEAAVAKLIRRLRKCGYDDEQILDTTKKSAQWLREQDRICALDDLTFSYLTNGKINRAFALRLTEIEDLERRNRHLRAAYDDALSCYKEEVKKAEDDLEKAVEKEEYVEAELEEAKIKGQDTTEVESKLEEAQERTTQKRQARSSVPRPKAKTPNHRRAINKLAKEGDENVADEVGQSLSPGKVQKQLEAIQAAIADGGKDEEGRTILDVAKLKACEVCYKAIIHGDEDVIRLLRRHHAAEILTQRRATMKAQEREVEIEEEVEIESVE